MLHSKLQSETLGLISLALLIAAAFSWYGVTNKAIRRFVKLPSGLGGGLAHDAIFAGLLTFLSVWWSGNVAKPAEVF